MKKSTWNFIDKQINPARNCDIAHHFSKGKKVCDCGGYYRKNGKIRIIGEDIQISLTAWVGMEDEFFGDWAIDRISKTNELWAIFKTRKQAKECFDHVRKIEIKTVD